MTLTWDKADTDVDTYVIDPTGDFFRLVPPHDRGRRGAGSGCHDRFRTGALDLIEYDVVRYDQPYKFRVHYFSDHNNGPTGDGRGGGVATVAQA